MFENRKDVEVLYFMKYGTANQASVYDLNCFLTINRKPTGEAWGVDYCNNFFKLPNGTLDKHLNFIEQFKNIKLYFFEEANYAFLIIEYDEETGRGGINIYIDKRRDHIPNFVSYMMNKGGARAAC